MDCFYVSLTTSGQVIDLLKELVTRYPGSEIYQLAGSYDILLKVSAEDMRDLNKKLNPILSSMEFNVLECVFHPVLSQKLLKCDGITSAFLFLKTEFALKETIGEVLSSLLNNEAKEIDIVSGYFDFVVELYKSIPGDVVKILDDIDRVPGVLRTITMFVLRTR